MITPKEEVCAIYEGIKEEYLRGHKVKDIVFSYNLSFTEHNIYKQIAVIKSSLSALEFHGRKLNKRKIDLLISKLQNLADQEELLTSKFHKCKDKQQKLEDKLSKLST